MVISVDLQRRGGEVRFCKGKTACPETMGFLSSAPLFIQLIRPTRNGFVTWYLSITTYSKRDFQNKSGCFVLKFTFAKANLQRSQIKQVENLLLKLILFWEWSCGYNLWGCSEYLKLFQWPHWQQKDNPAFFPGKIFYLPSELAQITWLTTYKVSANQYFASTSGRVVFPLQLNLSCSPLPFIMNLYMQAVRIQMSIALCLSVYNACLLIQN